MSLVSNGSPAAPIATSAEKDLVVGERYSVVVSTPYAVCDFEGTFVRLGRGAEDDHAQVIFDTGRVSGKWSATPIDKPGANPTPG